MELAERLPAARERPTWRAVAVPSEHGGWGLTLEPVLLGLLLVASWGGLLIGVAAFLAFVARTPSKLVAVDLRRGRWLGRTALAARVAAVELALVVIAVAAAIAIAGVGWWWVVLAAAPLIAVEIAYEIRSRGRRLAPELCGAAGVSAAAGAIVVAGGGAGSLALGAWLLLAARSLASIPFVRAQIARWRRGATDVRGSDAAQLLAAALGWATVALDARCLAGAVALTAIATVQAWWSRHDPPPLKLLGLRQMALGLLLVVVTAAGVAIA